MPQLLGTRPPTHPVVLDLSHTNNFFYEKKKKKTEKGEHNKAIARRSRPEHAQTDRNPNFSSVPNPSRFKKDKEEKGEEKRGEKRGSPAPLPPRPLRYSLLL